MIFYKIRPLHSHPICYYYFLFQQKLLISLLNSTITAKVFKLSKSLSNNIRKLRFEADEMSQQTLADKVGVTRQTIFAIEKDKYSPSLEVAFKISNVFKTSLEDVFTYDQRNFIEANLVTKQVKIGKVIVGTVSAQNYVVLA